jgi:excisionase family DNA binding protein
MPVELDKPGAQAAEPLLVGAVQAARLLGISGRLLWSMTAAGEIPSVRIRRRVLFCVQSLRSWIASREGRRDESC